MSGFFDFWINHFCLWFSLLSCRLGCLGNLCNFYSCNNRFSCLDNNRFSCLDDNLCYDNLCYYWCNNFGFFFLWRSGSLRRRLATPASLFFPGNPIQCPLAGGVGAGARRAMRPGVTLSLGTTPGTSSDKPSAVVMRSIMPRAR